MTDVKASSCTDADNRALHKQWDELLCPICMDHPHNAVLLLCSSHDKGCRSYICDTSYRHSNCLDRFKRLRSVRNDNSQNSSLFLESYDRRSLEQTSMSSLPSRSVVGRQRVRRSMMGAQEAYNFEENNGGISTGLVGQVEESSSQAQEEHLESQGQERIDLDESGRTSTAGSTGILKCPLCRGTIFSWKVVKEARQYLDLKSRSCSRESCSFSGNYRELRRHARQAHPTTRPADVEPSRQHAWRRLEHQHEYGDILSAIRSAMPGAIVFGDYVIDNGDERSDGRDSEQSARPWWTTFLLLHMFGGPLGSLNESRNSSRAWRSHRRPSEHRHLWGENLLGLRDDNEDRENDEIPIPRRRRRFTRARLDEDLP